jgi:hypothetical protein
MASPFSCRTPGESINAALIHSRPAGFQNCVTALTRSVLAAGGLHAAWLYSFISQVLGGRGGIMQPLPLAMILPKP